VVESIVRLGTLVKVVYDPRIGSRELARAADYETEIDITALCRWIKLEKYDDRGKHFPNAMLYQGQDQDFSNRLYPQATSVRSGVIGPREQALSLGEINGVWHASVQLNPRDYSLYTFHDEAKLLAYLTTQCGKIRW
jgi:hypothetical protein